MTSINTNTSGLIQSTTPQLDAITKTPGAADTTQAEQTSDTPGAEVFGPPVILAISEDGQPFLQSGDGTQTDIASTDATNTKTQPEASPTANKAEEEVSAQATPQEKTTQTPTTGGSKSSEKADDEENDSSKPAGGGGGGGGGAAVDSSSDEETAKRKIRAQVGSAGADQVVDKKGNIDHNILNKLLAQQETAKHRFDPPKK